MNIEPFIDYEVKMINANSLTFAYISAGIQKDPLVLLIHGFPDTAYTFQHVLPVLADNGYYAVAYFQRGYYPSDIPEDSDYSVYSLAEDALDIITALGKETAIIVGHDWGASAAYTAANIAPERVIKLIVLSIPHPSVIKPSFSTLRRASHFVELQFGSVSRWFVRRNNYTYLDNLLKYWAPNWNIPEEHLTLIKENFSMDGRLKASLGYYESFFSDRNNKEHQKIYTQKISVPTLAFAGEEDGPLNIELFEEMDTAFINEYRFIRVPIAGHFVHQEEFDIFINELLNFLQE